MEVDALLGGTSTGPHKVDPEPDDQWLQDIDEEDSKDEKGPPVNEQLAKMADRRFGKATAIPKVKDLQEKYLIPGNCKDATIPKVNGEVWQKVVQQDSRALKSRDFKLSNIQRALVGATGGLLHIMKALSEASKPGAKPVDTKQLFKTGLGSLSLLGHAKYEVSLRRRESLCSVLRTDLAPGLCSKDISVTHLLFGNDFSQSVKNAKQVAQMGRDVGKRSKNGWGSWKTAGSKRQYGQYGGKFHKYPKYTYKGKGQGKNEK